VDEDLVFSESEKPRYLLPEGCKDLYDVIRRQEEADARQKRLISSPPQNRKSLSPPLSKHVRFCM
jgi:hypothetical protein